MMVCVREGVFVSCFNHFTLVVLLLWRFLMHTSAAAHATQESVVELKHPPGEQESQSYDQCLEAVEHYEGVPCPHLVEYCKYAKQPGDSCGYKCSNDHTYVPALSISDRLCRCGGSFTH